MLQLLEKLNGICGLQVRPEEPLSLHTGFRTGGSTTMLIAETEEALCSAVLAVKQAGIPYFLLGRGSNVLALDDGYSGIVIKYTADSITVQGKHVRAAAGASLANLCRAAQQHCLTGLEFAYGIPGSVGGAVYMNAGAYDGQIADVICSARVLNEKGDVVCLDADALQLAYRSSVFHTHRDWVILSADFSLEEGDADSIAARMDELMQRRIDKQPLDYPSCGSTFKRPQGAYASKLIDECGLRGRSVGGAQVSEKHCGFVINRENATSADILQLCSKISREVEQKTGYVLEMEIEILK